MLRLARMLVAGGLAGLTTAQVDAAEDPFVAGSVLVGERSYPYRLLEPPAERRHERLPLVVFLHGAGERGDDNRAQLTWLPKVLAQASNRERYPCYLIAVQCPKGERWADAAWGDRSSQPMKAEPTMALRACMQAMDEVLASRRIDRGRVYLTGLSMGGYGTWDLVARHPDRFAAALAVCGGGDERIAGRLLGLPICVYHGAADGVVPVERSRVMVARLREYGVPVCYHELEGVRHDAWRQAYGDGGALPWLFAQDQRQQQRGSFATFAVVPAADAVRLDAGSFTLGKEARCVASGPAKAGAALFARVLELETGRRLPVVEGLAGPGDIAFRIDDEADDEIVLAIGDSFEVRCQSLSTLRRGAAMAVQALATWPDLSCPRGELIATRRLGGRVVVGGLGETWSGVAIMRLLRLGWLYGATELGGPGFDTLASLDPASRRSVRQEASLFGVTLASHDSEPNADPVVFEPSWPLQLDALLSQACPEPCPFLLRTSLADPDEVFRLLSVALPAAAERSARSRQRIRLGGFASRLGALLRRSNAR